MMCFSDWLCFVFSVVGVAITGAGHLVAAPFWQSLAPFTWNLSIFPRSLATLSMLKRWGKIVGLKLKWHGERKQEGKEKKDRGRVFWCNMWKLLINYWFSFKKRIVCLYSRFIEYEKLWIRYKNPMAYIPITWTLAVEYGDHVSRSVHNILTVR